MLMIVLLVLFFGTLILLVVRRRAIGRLSSFATLLAALIAMIWMQNHGLLPGGSPSPPPDSPAVSDR